MNSIGIGLVLLYLISGDALVLSGGNLAHIDTETGVVTPSLGFLHTYPNDIVIHDGYAFVVNSGNDSGTLQRFELGSWEMQELGIGTGWNCWASFPLANGSLAITSALNNSVSMVNYHVMQVTSTVYGVGPNPEWMDEEGDLLFVACGGWGSGESVAVINTTTGNIVDTLSSGINCQSVVCDGSGRLFVTCSGTYGSDNGSVAVIDISTGSVTAELSLGGFPAFSTDANGILYTADPWSTGVFAINMNTLDILHDAGNPLCAGGNGIAVDDSGYLWVSDGMADEVRVYDQADNLLQIYSIENPGPLAVSGSWTGISENSRSDVTLSVYPCPATSWATVSGGCPGGVVRVYDITGRIAAEHLTDQNGVCAIDAGKLQPGLYSVVCGEKTVRLAVTEE